MRIGIFTDIHFQPKGLDRIIKTGDWIIQEFERRGVDAVVCMGDALVTREEVDVAAQSAALDFFRRLGDKWLTHVILGNHDMNLKHARKVSSLDALTLHPNIRLYREMAAVKAETAAGHDPNTLLLMIPYHEDQTPVVEKMAQIPAEVGKQIVAFGHLAINGAVQITRYQTKFAGAFGPDIFKNLRRTYTGHFHVHQRMDHRVTYVGSPLQFNFGDAGDERGIMIYDSFKDTDEFILNPFYDAFKVVAASDLLNGPEYNAESLEGCFVTVIYDDVVTEATHESVCKQLEAVGVLAVRKESVIEKAIRDHSVDTLASTKSLSAEALVGPFVDSVLTGESQLIPDSVKAVGVGIIREVNASHQEVADTGAIFEADFAKITIENFLGVQDEIVIDFDKIKNGVWFLEGENGAGKSTILEAIYWCYYDETLRSDMRADWVINEVTKKNCRVRVDHRNGWSIERFRKYSALGGIGAKVYKDGVYQDKFEKGSPAATNREIVNLIGIDSGTFGRSVVLGQNVAANFVSAGDKERRALIEQNLGLERFDEYLSRTRELKKELGTQLDQQAEIQRIRATQIEQAATQVQQLELQIIQAEKDNEARLNSIEERRVAATLALRDILPELDTVTKATDQQITKADGEVTRLQSEVDAHDARSRGLESVRTMEAEVQNLLGTVQRIESIKANTAASLKRFAEARDRDGAELIKVTTRLEGYARIDLDGALAAHTKAEELKAASAELTRKAFGLQTTSTGLLNEKNRLLSEATRLKTIGEAAGQCPTCTQSVDWEKVKPAHDAIKDREVEAYAKMTAAEQEAKALEAQAKAILDEITTLVAGKPTPAQVAQLKANKVADEASKTRLEAAMAKALADGQAVEDAAKAELATLGNLDHLHDQVNSLKAQIAQVKASSGYDPVAHRTAREALQMARSALQQATAAQQQAQAAVLAKKAGLEATLAALWTERQGVVADPAAALRSALDALKNARQQALAEMESAKLLAHQIDQKMAYVVFWEKSFAAKGSMRAFLLDESVVALNSLLNSYLSQHFDGKMALTFDSNLQPQERYGCRSGGQRKWTDLCVLFSLFEIVRSRTRYRASFLALDEVFDALDAKGRRAVQDMLATLSARVSKILVITHAEIAGVSRAGTVRVQMTPKGTAMEVVPV